MSTSTPATVVLASSSVYRRELLSRLLTAFDCVAPDVDESPRDAEAPEELALRLARLKAEMVARQHPEALVIGSDQVAALDRQMLGKPGNHQRAVEQLMRCSNQAVNFHTAVVVMGPGFSSPAVHVDLTVVQFRPLANEEIEAYLRADQPYDCAGSFKAESLGISLFERIESTDPTALQGLPLIWLAAQLRNASLL